MNFSDAQVDYQPYPIVYLPNFLDRQTYLAMAESYPDLDTFKFTKNIGNKYSLSEVNNAPAYYDFLKKNPEWMEFYTFVKSPAFIRQTAEFLEQSHIDLRLGKFHYVKSVGYRRRDPLRRILNTKVLRSRFEFSAMPADGGSIIPHTDAPAKLVTLVLSFVKDGEWNAGDWGGWTSVVTPKDPTRVYNWHNKYMPFDEIDVLKTFPFVPNQCILFVKTYNSWHSVQPMTGPAGRLRKTLTINIEEIP